MAEILLAGLPPDPSSALAEAYARGELAAACPLLRQRLEGTQQPAAGAHPGLVEGQPRDPPAHHLLHVQRAGLPLRERLLLRAPLRTCSAASNPSAACPRSNTSRSARLPGVLGHLPRLHGEPSCASPSSSPTPDARPAPLRASSTAPCRSSIRSSPGPAKPSPMSTSYAEAGRYVRALRRRAVKGVPNGVKIGFTSGDGKTADALLLQHRRLQRRHQATSGFLKFCEQLRHRRRLREERVLSHAQRQFLDGARVPADARGDSLVQDDTGVPVRFLKTDDWKLRPFGRYRAHRPFQRPISAAARRHLPRKPRQADRLRCRLPLATQRVQSAAGNPPGAQGRAIAALHHRPRPRGKRPDRGLLVPRPGGRCRSRRRAT